MGDSGVVHSAASTASEGAGSSNSTDSAGASEVADGAAAQTDATAGDGAADNVTRQCHTEEHAEYAAPKVLRWGHNNMKVRCCHSPVTGEFRHRPLVCAQYSCV